LSLPNSQQQQQQGPTTVSPIRALVVDDEPALRRVLVTSLKASGFLVGEASNGHEALAAVRQGSHDIVLLDISMPGMNGLEACKQIRVIDANVGILMVTVRDSEDEKVEALESGADDYITKPFLFRELVARLRAVYRRGAAAGGPKPSFFKAGQLELDTNSRILKKNGVEIKLSPTEFDLLAVLVQHQGTPVTHRKLLRAVWGPEYGGELEYLRSYVKMLRKKIEDDPGKPGYILTDPWTGYRFCNPSDPDGPKPAAGEE
jgi:two-component system KDP operon response regulator KdpE